MDQYQNLQTPNETVKLDGELENRDIQFRIDKALPHALMRLGDGCRHSAAAAAAVVPPMRRRRLATPVQPC